MTILTSAADPLAGVRQKPTALAQLTSGQAGSPPAPEGRDLGGGDGTPAKRKPISRREPENEAARTPESAGRFARTQLSLLLAVSSW
ncbi:hypothetical protein GCM10023107_44310 [Actinoplanes octamycinicus]|nr:hypothetical protein Aoc01nite_42200 [Actinoplanes octamycinicus]